MEYESPNANFFMGLEGYVYSNIGDIDSHFWRGLMFSIATIVQLAIIGGLIFTSIRYNKWVGISVISLIVFIEVMSVIGFLFKGWLSKE